jgi:hypothetical protein
VIVLVFAFDGWLLDLGLIGVWDGFSGGLSWKRFGAAVVHKDAQRYGKIDLVGESGGREQLTCQPRHRS